MQSRSLEDFLPSSAPATSLGKDRFSLVMPMRVVEKVGPFLAILLLVTFLNETGARMSNVHEIEPLRIIGREVIPEVAHLT